MALLYKEDWEKTKARYLAWWAHEALGRCAIAVTAPKDNAPDIPEPKRPRTPDERWTDLDYISALNEYRLARTYYGGEMFPVWTGGHPGNKRLAVFLGCPITLSFDTGWLDPILTGENIEYESLRLDESEPHFQFTLKLFERAVHETKGKSIPSLGAFGGCGDTLAALRGNEQLLYDLIERPDQVRAADQHIMEIWCTVYDRFYNILKDAAEGSTCWFTLWSPQKFFSAHNDFSYMISPKDFVNLFLPTIERQKLPRSYRLSRGWRRRVRPRGRPMRAAPAPGHPDPARLGPAGPAALHAPAQKGPGRRQEPPHQPLAE